MTAFEALRSYEPFALVSRYGSSIAVRRGGLRHLYLSSNERVRWFGGLTFDFGWKIVIYILNAPNILLTLDLASACRESRTAASYGMTIRWRVP